MVPANVKLPYLLHIQNGEPNGENRVSSAWVEINGTQVTVPSDFNQNVASIDKVVTLTPNSALKITLASAPGSYLIISFCGQDSQSNRAPIGTNDAYNTGEDQVLTVAAPGVLANDSDPDGNAITAILAMGPTHGALTLNSNGSFVYTPNTYFYGVDSFTYKANDGSTDSNITSVNITVVHLNHPPVLDPIANMTVNEGTTLAFGINASDVDVDTLTYSASNLPTGAVFTGKTFTWTPNFSQAGTYNNIIFTVNDGKGGADSKAMAISVGNTNQVPVVVSIPSQIYSEGDTVNLQVQASDPDGDVLTYSAVGLAPGLSISTSGVVEGNLGYASAGTYTATVTVSDGLSSDSQSFTITVGNTNRAPIANDISASTDENVLKDITLSASDPDGDALAYTVASASQKGTVTINGDIATYVPAPGYSGTDAFTYVANDGNLNSNIATASITVNPVNHPVTWGPISLLSLSAGVPREYTVFASDVDGDPLTLEISSAPAFVTFTDNGNGSGVLYMNPGTEHIGAHFVVLSANDGTEIVTTTASLFVLPPIHDAVLPSLSIYNAYNPAADEKYATGPPISILNSDNIAARTNSVSEPSLSIFNGAFVHFNYAYGPIFSVNNVWGIKDLSISTISASGLVWDRQSLTVSGTISVTIKNSGTGYVTDPFNVVFFLDKNKNGLLDTNMDSVLGVARTDHDFNGPATFQLDAPVSGNVSFAGDLIWVMIDSANEIDELNENNNLLNTGDFSKLEPNFQPFNPTVKYRIDTFTTLPNAKDVTCVPAVADLNLDGIPDLVYITFNPGVYWDTGVLRAVSGKDGSELWSVSDPGYVLQGGASPAVGDIDLDGYPEIIAVTNDFKLAAFDHNGTPKWKTEVDWTNAHNACGGTFGGGECYWTNSSPAIANFDDDAYPEIIAGNVVLKHDGTILWKFPTDGRADNGFGSLTITADLDLDGKPEMIAGKKAYRQDGSVYWDLGGIGDGIPAVGNFDDDLYPEIAYASGGHNLYLLEHTGAIKWGPIDLVKGGGPPAIGDVNGDGSPEILVVTRYDIIVFNADGSVLWRNPIQENSLGLTGATVFDFEGDGKAEVVYGDNFNLRIYRGSDGAVLYVTPRESRTGYEYPVVADVDGDGHAEIVIGENLFVNGQGGLMVLGQDTWVGTRKIWNQHAYHMDNINDDASVPLQEPLGWLNHNTYRLNTMLSPAGPLGAPDIIPSYLIAVRRSMGTEITARVGNAGAVEVSSGVKVAFYNANPAEEGKLLGVTVTSRTLAPGDFQTVILSTQNTVVSTVWVVADDDGAGHGTIAEGNENNNTHFFTNHAPEIKSIPVTYAVVGKPYRYTARAEDPDAGDVLKYSLTAFPNGMTVNADNGAIEWTAVTEQIGVHSVKVVAADDKGWSGEQTFMVTATAESTNHAPLIGAIPDTSMEGGDILDIIFEYQDPDGDPVTLSATGLPVYAELTSYTTHWAKITFTPPALTLAAHAVSITVNDGALSSSEDFALVITPKNLSPIITSTPSAGVFVGSPYVYDVEATDPNNDTLAFSLSAAPEGMSIDSASGLISWTPHLTQTGTHAVAVVVSDPAGAKAYQTFSIVVSEPPNNPPTIASNAPTQVLLGYPYSYQIAAQDPDGDPITFILTRSPNGMTIDPGTGFISWPDNGFRPSTAAVTVAVFDARGKSAEQSWVITILPIPPFQVYITAVPERVFAGETTLVEVRASTHPLPVTFVADVDGTPLELNASGAASYATSQVGFHVISATATLSSGAISHKTILLPVGDANDTTYPEVALHNEEWIEVTDVTQIAGHVFDLNGARYRLQEREQGTGQWVTFSEGYAQPLSSGTLGAFDPTMLRNGVHDIRLYAEDPSGNISTVGGRLLVDGGLKLGQVNFAVTDMVFPEIGIPLTLEREYDSRSQAPGDFGPGWNLANKNMDVSVTEDPSESWGLSVQTYPPPFPDVYYLVEHSKHTVALRLGEGKLLKFRMDVNPKSQAAEPLQFLTVDYLPVENTQGTLEALDFGREVILQSDRLTDYDLRSYSPKKFKYTSRGGTAYVIDMDKGLESITDVYGRTVSYDDAGIHHSSGTSLVIERDASNRIERVRDATGRVVEYHYGADGTLEKALQIGGGNNALQRIIGQYGYLAGFADQKIYLKDILSPDGVRLGTFEYDQQNRVVGLIDPDNNRVVYGYDLPNHKQIVTDPLGHETLYEFNGNGDVTRKVNALGNETRWQYDSAGNLISLTDADGSTKRFGYNSLNELVSFTVPHRANEDPENYTTAYTRDSKGHITSVRQPSGAITNYEYDVFGNEISVKDGGGNTIFSSTFDGNGNLTNTTSRYGTVSRTYDLKGNCIQSVDAYGRISTITFNALSQITSASENGQTIQQSYDGFDRVERTDFGAGLDLKYEYASDNIWRSMEAPTMGQINRTLSSSGKILGWALSNGTTVQYQYDALNRPKKIIDPYGNQTVYEYDAVGQTKAVIHSLDGRVEHEYDPAGKMTKVKDPLGNITEMTYTPDGQIETVKDSLGSQWGFEYSPTTSTIIDPLGRRWKKIYSPEGLLLDTINADGTSKRFRYEGTSLLDDSNDFLKEIIEEGGYSRKFEYDNFGKLIGSYNQAGSRYQYLYSNDFMNSIVTPSGWTWRFLQDDLNNLAAAIHPDGSTRQYVYNAKNKLSSEIMPSGTIINYQYDNNLWLTGIKSLNEDVVTFERNTDGSVSSMLDETGRTGYQYDARGQLKKIDFPNGSRIDYDWDILGRINQIGMTPPGSTTGYAIQYQYDQIGNLKKISGPGNSSIEYEYDEVRRVKVRKYGNGVVATIAYTERDQISSIEYKNAVGEIVASVAYQRNEGGEPVGIVWEDGSRLVLKYDSARRIEEERYYNNAGLQTDIKSYQYDLEGNRTLVNSSAGDLSYRYAHGYKLVSADGSSGLETYSYDLDGRLSELQRNGAHLRMAHGISDRLESVENVVRNSTITYTYNGIGHRVMSSDDSIVRQFVVAPAVGTGLASTQMILDQNGGLISAYIYNGYNPVFEINGSTVVYYITDAMNSVVGHMDETSQRISYLKYDSFGNILLTSGSPDVLDPQSGGAFRFHGHWQDQDTGFYHMRARDYDSHTGRFLSRDPVSPDLYDPESMNPYVFVRSNPQYYIDPTGGFTLVELSMTDAVNGMLQSLKNTVSTEYLRKKVREELSEQIGKYLYKTIESLLPMKPSDIAAILDVAFKNRPYNFTRGKAFERLAQSNMETDGLYFEVSMDRQSGQPVSSGIYYKDIFNPLEWGGGRPIPGTSRPDFLTAGKRPSKEHRKNDSWIVGDFKHLVSTARDHWEKNADGRLQFQTIINHAKNYETAPLALLITAKRGGTAKDFEENYLWILKNSISKGCFMVILVLAE